ncbi:MAG: NAD(P)/FAD-dependent oxidoreductase [Acidimicrobiia bacterium]
MKTQVAIVGGGPAGSASSLYLSQLGISSVIVEEERFPRFHVGESMTGWAAERLRDFGFAEDMNRHRFPVKYGGTVYPMGAASFFVPTSTRVTGTERREVPTWQVRRSNFDQMLLEAAIEKGAEFLPGTATDPIMNEKGAVSGVHVAIPNQTSEDIRAEVVIDASGRSTWLSRVGLTGKKYRGNYANQIAVYSHVTGAIRNPGSEEGNTLLFYKKTNHWAWFIPVDPEVVSIGVVVPTEYYRSRKESKEQFFARELSELNPNLTERLGDIELVEEVHATANFSYQIEAFTGPGYLCVGDSHRFIDPFFSFGIHLALSEAEKAAGVIGQYLDGELRNSAQPFSNFERLCDRGMDTVQDLIDAFWNNPLGWGYMLHYTNYGGDMLDIFGGMIYDDEPSPGLEAMRRINRKARAEAAAS